ncbi:MAG: MFS transporter [Saccharofermentanales bacterium]|nr:MFS transporter [Clostridiaceae bacterium]
MGTEPKQPLWSRNFIFICLIGLLVSVGMQVLNSTMTLYADSLGASATFSGVMGTLFAIFAGLFRMISGRVSDVRGRRVTMMVGAVIFSISLLAFGAFAVLPALLVFRSTQAIGFSSISTASAAAAADVTPRKRLGEGLGFFSLGQSLSMAIGPAFGLAFAGRGEFKTLYFITAGLVAVCFLIALSLNYEKKMTRTRPDIAEAKDKPDDLKQRGIWTFLDRNALPASLTYMLVCLASGGIVTFLPLYAKGKDFTHISIFFLLQAAAMFLTRLLAGRIFDRKGPLLVLIPALCCSSIAFAMILLAQNEVIFLLAGFFYGIGFGTLQPVYNALAMQQAPFYRRGAASATFNLSVDLGIGAGAAIWGIIIDQSGFSPMFIGSIGLMLLTALASVVLFSKVKQK